MIRSLKTLSFALLAIAAASVAISPSAGAQERHFGGAPGIQTIHGSQTATATWKLTPSGPFTTRYLKCTEASYGNFTNTMSETQSEIIVSPFYANCSYGNIFSTPMSVSFRMNDCDYRIYDVTTVEAARVGKFQITCPVSYHMELEITQSGKFKCTITLIPQQTQGGVTWTNAGGEPADLNAAFALSGMHYVEHDEKTDGTKAEGSEACADGTGTDGTFESEVTFSGSTHTGLSKGVWIE